ncbi:shikimate kinase [Balneola sp. MJW-20]|uniref:shikimate kinase n=1 Tax=Gracilimonas aurantiaca TaxID=3234185 RepID=UPI00390C3E16
MNERRLNRFKGGIFLTGFMASGKSTYGKALAELLDWPFTDLDQYIEKEEGRSINEIFKQEGEEYFRTLERKAVLSLTPDLKNQVVALGGGALHNQHMVDHLKFNGLLICFETPMVEITKRVFDSSERPILYRDNGEKKTKEMLMDELKTLYSGRKKWYDQSQITINTANYKNNEDLIRDLIKKIQLHV